VSVEFEESYIPQYQGYAVYKNRELIFDEDYEKYMTLLEYDGEKDVYEENNTVFVRTRYKGEGFIHYSGAANGGEKPLWIENPPSDIDGYPAATGFASGHLAHKNTVIASYEDAVFALLLNSSLKMAGVQETYNNLLFDTMASRALGTIKGFYVVETWTDPETKAVWTLAVAREIEGSVSGVSP
jgi:hypothetical protein